VEEGAVEAVGADAGEGSKHPLGLVTSGLHLHPT
jgi:hypothetical protein